MRMKERKHGRITILEFQENLKGGDQADEFRERQVKLIEDGAVHQIFNIKHVKFIPSQGVGMMIGANVRCEKADGRLVICEPNDRIQSLFSLYKIERIIDLYATEAEAIASFGFEEDEGTGKA